MDVKQEKDLSRDTCAYPSSVLVLNPHKKSRHTKFRAAAFYYDLMLPEW